MAIKQANIVTLPRAELLCALQHMTESRVCRALHALCRAATLDYFSAVQGDFTFRRGDMAFKPKNAWEERFWANIRNMQKQRFIHFNKLKGGKHEGQ